MNQSNVSTKPFPLKLHSIKLFTGMTLTRTPPLPPPLPSAGVRVCGAAQRLHDPHASRSQLWHHQVPFQQAVPRLPAHPEGGVPAEHVAPLRLRRPQVHDSREQQLAERLAGCHAPCYLSYCELLWTTLKRRNYSRCHGNYGQAEGDSQRSCGAELAQTDTHCVLCRGESLSFPAWSHAGGCEDQKLCSQTSN